MLVVASVRGNVQEQPVVGLGVGLLHGVPRCRHVSAFSTSARREGGEARPPEPWLRVGGRLRQRGPARGPVPVPAPMLREPRVDNGSAASEAKRGRQCIAESAAPGVLPDYANKSVPAEKIAELTLLDLSAHGSGGPPTRASDGGPPGTPGRGHADGTLGHGRSSRPRPRA